MLLILKTTGEEKTRNLHGADDCFMQDAKLFGFDALLRLN